MCSSDLIEDGQNDDDNSNERQAGQNEDDISTAKPDENSIKPSEESEEEENEVQNSGSTDTVSEKTKKKLQDLTVDYARGEGVLDSDTEDEDDSYTSNDSTSSEEDEGIEDMSHGKDVPNCCCMC